LNIWNHLKTKKAAISERVVNTLFSNLDPTDCILCGKSDVTLFFEDNSRKYLRCSVCALVFVPSYQRLSAEEELKRYDLHQNSPDDKRYKKFLNKLFIPLNNRLLPGSCGLDFGSGPGPTLHRMFMDYGHDMNIFDCFYADNQTVFEYKYDFITATEVLEHLFNPQKELDRLWACLKPGGVLGIMTGFVEGKEAFKNWYYKKDPTHVAFYSEKTFEWLRKKWRASLEIFGDGVVIFRKSD
jgi:SAM-dependent methyltransferase